jgi:lysophospholipase L1-like esterase
VTGLLRTWKSRWIWLGKRVLAVVLAVLAALLAAELLVSWLVPVRNVGPSWSVYDPVYLQVLKKNFRGRRKSPEFDIELTTNSLGFRGPEPGSTPQDVVLFLGDSFTLGYGVSDGEEFPAIVTQRLKDRWGPAAPDTINAGIGGSGNGYWLKFLRHEAARYRPRLVVLQFCANDYYDNLQERLFDVDANGQLVELPVPMPGRGRQWQALLESLPVISRTHLYGLARQAVHPAPAAETTINSGPDPRGETLALALVRACLAECRRQQWDVLLVTEGLLEAECAALRQLSSEFGAETLRVPTKDEAPDNYFKIDGHWNTAGQRAVAELVAERILKREAASGASPDFLMQRTE